MVVPITTRRVFNGWRWETVTGQHRWPRERCSLRFLLAGLGIVERP